MRFNLWSIAELAHELVKHVEALGYVLLGDCGFENQILAEISLTEDPTLQIEHLTSVKHLEQSALIRIRHWHESRTRPVSEWCQSFARSWVKAQRNKSDAYTCQLDELFYIGETEEVIEEILANRQYREILENYSRAVRRSERYNWLTKQIEHIRSQKLYDEIKDIKWVTQAVGNPEAGENKPPLSAVYIVPEAIKVIYNALKKYVDEAEHSRLKEVLRGQTAEQPVFVRLQQNTLVDVFWQAIDAQKISSSKTDVKNWLCKWFLCHEQGQRRQLNASSVYPQLISSSYQTDGNKKNLRPAKTKRINITF